MLHIDCGISPATDTIIPLKYVLRRCAMMKWIDKAEVSEALLAIFFRAFSG